MQQKEDFAKRKKLTRGGSKCGKAFVGQRGRKFNQWHNV